MAHYFNDRLIVFIGNPKRCSRKEAKDALIAEGGIVDERITMFTHFAVAFEGAEKTKVYQKAAEHDEHGLLVLLNEEQFFDVLNGRDAPPEKKIPKTRDGVTVFEATDPDESARNFEQSEQYFLAKKRVKNKMKNVNGGYDNGGAKAYPGNGNYDVIFNFASDMIRSENYIPMSIAPTNDGCDNCGSPSEFHLGDGKGNELFHLCRDCYNEMLAQITGTETPDDMPKHLDFQFRGKTYRFAIEARIYTTGKTIPATEIGKTRRKTDVNGELDDSFGEMFETLKKRIKKLVSVRYMEKDGYFARGKAVGYIEYNRERQACDVIIDGKPYSWEELEKNISSREGWKIKIEFGDIGDVLD